MTSITELAQDYRINEREFQPFRINMERNIAGFIEKHCARCGKKIIVNDDRIHLCRFCYLGGVI